MCLFKSGIKDTSTNECIADRALWGSKHTCWSSMRALWSSEGTLLLSRALKKTYYSERDITEDCGYIQDILPTGVFI